MLDELSALKAVGVDVPPSSPARQCRPARLALKISTSDFQTRIREALG